MKIKFYLSFCLFLLVCISVSQGQNISISLGPDQIALNEAFTITITVKNERITGYEGFPEIPGFLKRGTSSSSSTNIINGQISSSQSVTQNYIAQKEGSYTLKPFSMVINGEDVSAPGKTIKVGPARQQQRNQYDPFGSDPFDDLFSRRNAPQEFIEVKEDAFFGLSTSKDEVYLGEGFTVTLALYVAETNQAQLDFYDLGPQLSTILKEIRPDNCWEENFNIESISGVPVTINGKRHRQYKVYQAVYYPLNLKPIKFPSVGLKLIKYKESTTRSFFGRSRKEDYKTFYTKAKTVKVKDLPPHPLKDKVSVGEYQLVEKIDKKELSTGEGFNYNMSIRGEGNISAINNPVIAQNRNIEFYDPNVQVNINRSNNKVTGEKTFKYYGVPKEPGEFPLQDYLKWIYFSPSKAAYDTLKSDITLKVTGESLKNQTISSRETGRGFYTRLEDKSNSLQSRSGFDVLQISANLFVLIILIFSGWIFFKK